MPTNSAYAQANAPDSVGLMMPKRISTISMTGKSSAQMESTQTLMISLAGAIFSRAGL